MVLLWNILEIASPRTKNYFSLLKFTCRLWMVVFNGYFFYDKQGVERMKNCIEKDKKKMLSDQTIMLS
jgi:hypothetical protein